MHLDPKIIETLKQYTANLEHKIQLKLYHGEHAKRDALISMLEQVASVSNNVEFIVAQTEFPVREGLTFELMRDGEKTGVLFSGIPGGHEFNSFVLALLQAGGTPIKLEKTVQNRIRSIKVPLQFETIISLDCHICPDVVQLFNQLALLNPLISNEMIDGAVHPIYVNERNIQGVPTVLLNKRPFASGGITIDQVVEKIAEHYDIEEAEQIVDSKVHDVVVIGGGPAATSAAIYTARKGLDVVLVAEKIGGQLNDTQTIENLIGTPKTTGPDLVSDMGSHLASYPINIKQQAAVKSIQPADEGNPHLILLSSGTVLQSKTVIIATGAKWRELGVPGEKENIGRGVAFCPHCDGPYFKGKDIVVVGGGNSGVEAALDLSAIAKSVTVLEFMPELKADKVLQDKLESTQNTSVITGVETRKINANSEGVQSLELLKRESDETIIHPTEGIFVQIGLVPNSSFVKGVINTNRFGEILVDERGNTNVDGIFAAGDVTTVPYKQIIIAMGEGAKAGLSAFDYLLKQ